MLNVGRDRLLDRGSAGNIQFGQADAQYLPFPNNSFDCISIAVGLRNVTDEDPALSAMFAALKAGGRLSVLEFSQPQNRQLLEADDACCFKLSPLMGKLMG